MTLINKSQKLTILFKLCTNKNHSYKHNEQINDQNIDNSECFGVKLLKSIQKWLHNKFLKKYGFGWLYKDFFLHVAILLATYCTLMSHYNAEFNPRIIDLDYCQYWSYKTFYSLNWLKFRTFHQAVRIRMSPTSYI